MTVELTGAIQRVPLLGLDDSTTRPGFTRYIRLYNPSYHDVENGGSGLSQGVVVTPEEVGLISLREEVADATLVMLPILSFWLGTIFVFSSKYSERYGGNFMDAMLGR